MEISLRRGLGDGMITATPPPNLPVYNAPPCPPGFFQAGYADGLSNAFRGGIGWALIGGLPQLLPSPNAGNIIGPQGGESACWVPDRTPFMYRLGFATPAIVAVTILGMLLFGGKR